MNIVITASANTTDVLAALVAGEAKVHSEREDGSYRARHFLTGSAREHAEWVRLQREGQEADEAEGVPAVAPRSMGSIAAELHVSISAVRRVLVDLAVTEELEEMEADELAALLQGMTEAEAGDPVAEMV
jgi:hypothetical protein